MKRLFFSRLWPILFIFFVWFIFSSPYFVKGLVPFPSTYQVNHFAPWSNDARYWGPVKNGAMPDLIDQIYPWKKFTVDSLKNGQIPWWNPYNFTGNPHVGNFQTAVFSPFNILYFILPFIDAWSLVVLLQPFLGGLFTYLLLRSFKVSKSGSAVSAATFMFSGFMVVWMAYGTLSMALLFLPLALYAIEQWYQKEKIKWLALLPVAIVCSIFSGHFQTSIYVLLFTAGFYFYKVITIQRNKTSLYVFFAFVLGIIISLIQLIPSISLYQESVRSGIFINSGGIPFPYLITLVAPDFFGNPVTRNDWFGYYAEWASFVGIIPLTLSALSVREVKKDKLFFLISGIVLLLLAIDSPIQAFIGTLKIPVISTSTPSRIIALFSFSLSVLAGFGFDYLSTTIKEKESWKKLVWPTMGVISILAIAWVFILLKPFSPETLAIAKRNLILPTILLLGFVSAAFLVSYKKKLTIMLILFILLAVSFDSLRYAQKWMPFDPKNLVFPDSPVISAMKQQMGNGRVFGNIRAQVSTYYGIPVLDGYDPLYVERYGTFIRSASTGQIQRAERSVVTLDRLGKYTDRVLDLLGVTLIFHPIADTNQSWAYPVWKDQKRFELVYKDDLFQLFKNNTALPRAALFYNYEVISEGDLLLKRFYDDDFDFRKTLLLEQDPYLKKNAGTKGSAHIISYSPNRVVIEVESSSDSLLFLSDTFYKNWHAFIIQDLARKEVPVLRADYAFKAVKVPSGKSTVEFDYQEF